MPVNAASPTIPREFFAKARQYLDKPAFVAHEIEPKLRAAGEFRLALHAYKAGKPTAFDTLTAAFQNQNFVDWRTYDAFLRTAKHQPQRTASALRQFWDDSSDLSVRLNRFGDYLSSAGTDTNGGQLTLSSLLLSGLSGHDYPHVLTNAFRNAFESAGYPSFRKTQNAADRYIHALGFFDALIAEGKHHGIELQNRMEARAVAWCIGQEVDPHYYDAESYDAGSEVIPLSEALSLVHAAARGRKLSRTEVQALVSARLGQGKFRQGLLQSWGKCSVTGCRNSTLLRASHIKPWKDSSNTERLEPYNGLLLSPALDAAFDRGLVSFRDNGAIMISPALSSADLKCVGIGKAMKLEYVDSRHVPFLRYHRQHRFIQK